MNKILLAFACLLSVVSFGGCGASKATLFVDNDSKDAMFVEIDGGRRIYVQSGRYIRRHLEFGEHHIKVERDGEVIFDRTKDFQPLEGMNWRHFLLDPDADTRYAVYEIYYYKDQETANRNKRSRRLNRLPRAHWVSVPRGVSALETSSVVFTKSENSRVARKCVQAVD